jgi:hypothetical protein
MAGEKLKKPAEFICGDLPKWVLDFKNGDKITYAIESGNKYNLLCGLETRDNNGDQCEICITKKEGRNVLIEFKYGSRTVWFTGFMA